MHCYLPLMFGRMQPSARITNVNEKETAKNTGVGWVDSRRVKRLSERYQCQSMVARRSSRTVLFMPPTTRVRNWPSRSMKNVTGRLVTR